MRHTERRRAWWTLFGVLAMAASLLVACGGGVGSGGTGASFTSGAVTGFGSVIVGGVRYDDRSARVEDDDGTVRSSGDLRLGMVTDIEYTRNSATAAVARSIRFRSELIGPVSVINATDLTALGQRVAILPTTVIDAASLPMGLPSLSTGEVVEVYGQFDVATSRITATRVERHGVVSSYKLKGPIASIDTTARTFVIGVQTISYAGVASVPPSLLQVGQFVRATLQTAPSGGILVATGLQAASLQLDDREEVEIEGRVSAYTSPAVFSVDGIPVDGSAASFSGSTGSLVLGAEVKVKGRSVSGTLVAREVEVDDEEVEDTERFELNGTISAPNAGAQTFIVRGVTVSYNGSTRFEGGTAANLTVGRKVEVKGVLSADGTLLDASSIKIEN